MNGAAKSSNNIKAAFSHCVQEVRNYDYHHYLCLLHLPPPMRKPAFALRAFNIEIARAMDVASDPKIGLMRLLWWQDAIDKIYSGNLISHPTAAALSSVISSHKINKTWLKKSISARINDANREPNSVIEKVSDLENYSEDAFSTILYNTLQAGGINSTQADHAASHIGKASGLLLLLKSIPYHLNRTGNAVYIPREVKSRCGEEMNEAVFEIASVANTHLEKARALSKTVPKEAVPVLLPAVPAQVLLDSIRRCGFDVFDSRLRKGVVGVSPLWFQLKLQWHAWRSSY